MTFSTMSVTSKIFQKKIQSLRPDLATGLTPDILHELCDDSTMQPFLKWFCDNVSYTNVLSKDELYLKNKLQGTEEWLSGKELDEALKEATLENPDLLKLIDLDHGDMDEPFVELEILKDFCKTEKDYIHSLRSNMSHIKELGFILEDEIEQETNNLEIEQIEMDKAYNDCIVILEKLENRNHSVYKAMENLLNVYTVENKATPVLWMQMPLDLFIKSMRLYNDYLDMFIKRQFNMKYEASKQDTLTTSSTDEQFEEQVKELTLCKLKLTNSKFEEIDARSREASYKAMMEYAHSIYNNAHVNVPNEMQLTDEILDLSRKRSTLEENVMLLREGQLTQAIERYVEIATTKVLHRATCAKMKRRKNRFDKLKFLLSLTRDHGHAHSDLLCMLMSIQSNWLKEISEFITDARYYFTTEYSRSSTRCENMRQQQEIYEVLQRNILSRNTFNRLFISMMSGNDISPDALDRALEKYDQVIVRNKEKKQEIFENYFDKQIDKISLSEKKLSQCYEEETRNEITASVAPFYYELNEQYENTFDKLEGIRTNLAAMRNALKEEMRNSTSFKRKKDILWQRFLVDPDTLRKEYLDAKKMVDSSHFGKEY